MGKELLFSLTKKDFIVEPYKGSGAGGQHRNKTMSCVRIKHLESGSMATACESRDQRKNKPVAFKRLVESEKFQVWLKKKASEMTIDSETIMKRIEEWMKPEHLIIHYGDDV